MLSNVHADKIVHVHYFNKYIYFWACKQYKCMYIYMCVSIYAHDMTYIINRGMDAQIILLKREVIKKFGDYCP